MKSGSKLSSLALGVEALEYSLKMMSVDQSRNVWSFHGSIMYLELTLWKSPSVQKHFASVVQMLTNFELSQHFGTQSVPISARYDG